MTKIEFNHKLIDLQKRLLKYAYNLTLNKDDAQDLVQETSLKVLKYCDKFSSGSNFNAWVYTIMKNTFINNYRRSEHYNIFSDQNNEGFFMSCIKAPNSYDPDSIYSFKELEESIEELNEKLKLPFQMHHNGFKYSEIAKKLDLNIGTVKSRIFFSRKTLIKQLR
jgi:RNA polymerase sigma-70 factor, ECF subfamily